MENLQRWIKDNTAYYYKTSCPSRSSIRINSSPPPEIVLLKESIGSLIMHSSIKHFPNIICELTNLYNLEIINGTIKEIPETIYKLKNLKELWLNSALITSIPKSVCKLRKLEVLCLSYCPIKELPPLLGKIQLKHFYISKGNIIIDWLDIIFLIYKSYKTATSCRPQYFLQPVNELL